MGDCGGMALSVIAVFLLVALILWTALEFIPTKIPGWVRSLALAVVLWLLAAILLGWIEN